MSNTDKIKENLSYKKKNLYESGDESLVQKINAFAEQYKNYLNKTKTEREAVSVTVDMAKSCGYTKYKLGSAIND